MGGQGNDKVQGNLIGTNAAGTAAVGNVVGIRVGGGRNAQIGGTSAAARNLISGNVDGVVIQASGTVVQGNYVGTDVAGTRAVPNQRGLGAGGDHGLIGGTAPGAGNLISGNRFEGLVVAGRFNRAEGNLIGTDITGTVALGNGTGVAVVAQATDATVGGTAAGAGNVISGNVGIGMSIAAVFSLVQGNLVGTDAAGTAALGNGGTGVLITSAGSTVGGTVAGAGNTIAFNGGPGVVDRRLEFTGNSNAIRGNSIHSNGGLGIDLDEDGVTPNDAGDADGGANRSQNFPVLSAALAGAATGVTGALHSRAATSFTLDFYASAAADPSGFGEGQRYLGSVVVTTDGNGNAHFDVTLDAQTVLGEYLSATATDPDGNTSEFSLAALIE
jgi:titin